MNLHVAVAASDVLARTGLRMTLERAGVEVVDAGAEVVVWDLGANGARDLGLARALEGPTPVVVLVASGARAGELVAAGARGVLSRDIEGMRLVSALAAARSGSLVVDPEYVAMIGRAPAAASEGDEDLTPRESEVLKHLAGGLANKEIAVKLGISDHTVKFHVNSILEKLGASTRTEAVVRGVRRGLVSI